MWWCLVGLLIVVSSFVLAPRALRAPSSAARQRAYTWRRVRHAPRVTRGARPLLLSVFFLRSSLRTAVQRAPPPSRAPGPLARTRALRDARRAARAPRGARNRRASSSGALGLALSSSSRYLGPRALLYLHVCYATPALGARTELRQVGSEKNKKLFKKERKRTSAIHPLPGFFSVFAFVRAVEEGALSRRTRGRARGVFYLPHWKFGLGAFVNIRGSKMGMRPSSPAGFAGTRAFAAVGSFSWAFGVCKAKFPGPGVLWAIQQNPYVKLA